MHITLETMFTEIEDGDIYVVAKGWVDVPNSTVAELSYNAPSGISDNAFSQSVSSQVMAGMLVAMPQYIDFVVDEPSGDINLTSLLIVDDIHRWNYYYRVRLHRDAKIEPTPEAATLDKYLKPASLRLRIAAWLSIKISELVEWLVRKAVK